MEIKLANGYTCDVSPDALADYELLEDLVDMEDGHVEYTIRVARKLLQPDDLKRLKEVCRTESGRVDMTSMFTSIGDIIKQLGEQSTKAKK